MKEPKVQIEPCYDPITADEYYLIDKPQDYPLAIAIYATGGMTVGRYISGRVCRRGPGGFYYPLGGDYTVFHAVESPEKWRNGPVLEKWYSTLGTCQKTVVIPASQWFGQRTYEATYHVGGDLRPEDI